MQRPQIAAHQVPLPVAQHDSELVALIPDPLTQLVGVLENRPNFGRGIAAERNVRGGQRGEDLQRLLIMLTRLFERFQKVEASGQVTDRFALRRSLPRPQACLEPVADRLFGQSRLGEVVPQQLWLRLGDLWEPGLEHLGDPPMELLSLALDERVIERILEEGVFEYVGASGRPALRVQDLRLHQLRQLDLERELVVGPGGEQLIAELTAEHRGELGHLAIAIHEVEAGHHQVLKRCGDLPCHQGFDLSAIFLRDVQHPRLLHHLCEFLDKERHAR